MSHWMEPTGGKLYRLLIGILAGALLLLDAGTVLGANYAATAAPMGWTLAGSDAAMSESGAVWIAAGAGGAIEVRYRNLSTGTERVLASGPSLKQSPAIDGNLVVWSDRGSYGTASAYWDILAFNLETGTAVRLNSASGQYAEPSVDGTDIVWFDLGGNESMHYYNWETGREILFGRGRYPVVAEGNVVYKNVDDGGLSSINLSTYQKRSLYSPEWGRYVSWFVFNGSYAVWKESDGSGASSYGMIAATPYAQAVRLTEPSVKGTEYAFLDIGDSKAVWLEDVNGTAYVNGVHLADGSVFSLGEASAGVRPLLLNGETLVWSDGAGQLTSWNMSDAESPVTGGSGTDSGSIPLPGLTTGGGSATGEASPLPVKQAVIGPTGGSLTIPGVLSLSVPAGAFSKDAAVSVREWQDAPKDYGLTPQMELKSKPWLLQMDQPLKLAARLAMTVKEVKESERHQTGIYRYDSDTGLWKFIGDAFADDGLEVWADITEGGVYAVIVNRITFTDMDGHWARRTVERLAARSVIDGMPDGGYHPDETLTRAQFAKLLAGALQLDTESLTAKKSRFADVPTAHWAGPWVEAAAQAGLIEGVGDGRFDPEGHLSREAMMTMLVRACGLADEALLLDPAEIASILAPYEDQEDVSGWARPYAAQAVKSGLIEGAFGQLNAAGSSTRAEAATVIERLLDR